MNMVLHEHCSRCYDARCRVELLPDDETSCEVISCPSDCNVSLHKCKVEEHLEQTCTNYNISCTNSLYGCPHTFPRHKLMTHLRHCPASVVTCSLEWNRWCRDSSIGDISTDISADELDIMLATRDQQILEESLKLPRRLRHSLKNTYTGNFPAVPLVQRASSIYKNVSLEESTDSLDFLTMDEEEQLCQEHYNIPGKCILGI